MAEDVTAIEKTQEQLAVRVAKTKAKKDIQIARNQKRPDDYNSNTFDPVEESSDDKEEYEEVFTLGRMNTRLQTRVSRYYTHAEVQADIEEVRAEKEFVDRHWYELISSGDNEESQFDTSEDEEFDIVVEGDEDIADENM